MAFLRLLDGDAGLGRRSDLALGGDSLGTSSPRAAMIGFAVLRRLFGCSEPGGKYHGPLGSKVSPDIRVCSSLRAANDRFLFF